MDFHRLVEKLGQLEADSRVEECGCMDANPASSMAAYNPAPVEPQIPPPNMNVSLNAQGIDNISQMMQLFQKVNPDMITPKTAAPVIDTTTTDLVPVEKGDTEFDSADDDMPDAVFSFDGDRKEGTEFSDSTTEPDEQYKDIDYITNKLSGGMNGPKGTYPKVAGGDNPMQDVKEDAFAQLKDKIKQELAVKLAEAKARLGSN